MTSVAYADGTSDSFSYDPLGRRIGASNANVSYTYGYDALNRITSVKNNTSNMTFMYVYDAAGNRTKQTATFNSGPIATTTTTLTYDAKNRATQIADSLVGAFNLTYDAMDRRTSLTYPNGITTSYAYDDAYRLTAIAAKNRQNQIVDAWSYQYDAAGNRTSKTGFDGKAEVYAYDSVDRLTSATYTDGTSETFTYDAVGNRLTRSDQNGITTTSSYDIANQLLTAGSDALTYDNNGNMLKKVTSGGTTTLTYNQRNLPMTITAPDGTETNQYGPNGERTSVRSPQAGDLLFVQYDLAGNPVADVLGANFSSHMRNYRVYGPGVDEPLAEWQENHPIHYLHHDALGSVTLATDSNATPLYARTYSAFGTPTVKTYGTSNVGQTRLGYTSRENAVGGLMGYRSRTYDPAYGRFAQVDTFTGDSGEPPSLHRYTYALNAPVKHVDPSGHGAGWPFPGKKIPHLTCAELVFAAQWLIDDIWKRSGEGVEDKQGLPDFDPVPGKKGHKFGHALIIEAEQFLLAWVLKRLMDDCPNFMNQVDWDAVAVTFALNPMAPFVPGWSDALESQIVDIGGVKLWGPGLALAGGAAAVLAFFALGPMIFAYMAGGELAAVIRYAYESAG